MNAGPTVDPGTGGEHASPGVAPPRVPGGGRLVLVDAVAPQAWRNGGGRTRELMAGPAGAPDWGWRLSVADIHGDGPFSAFPGVERWFVVLEGAGVDLSWRDGRRTVRRGDDPLCFDGGDPPACRLPAGPTRDLNLMLRGVAGRVTSVRGSRDTYVPDMAGAGLFAWTGGTLHVDTEVLVVPARCLCWWDRAPIALTFEPDDRTAGSAWWVALGSPG